MVNLENCYFIEKAIQKHDVESIIERAKREVELYPIIVPSYKNRYSAMYDYFEKNKIKFLVFVYEDDFTASGYDKYEFKYGTIVRITPEDFAQYGLKGKLLGKKRFYIQKYAEAYGIDKYFTIDDDYIPEKCAKYPKFINGKTKTEHLEYVDFLKSLQYIFDSYDLAMCSATDGARLREFRFDTAYYEQNINGTFIVNNKKLTETNIFWETEPMFEDDDMCIKLKLAKLPYGRISCFSADNNCDRTKSVIPERDELAFNLYRKYPWCTDIRVKYSKDFDKYVLVKVFNQKNVTKDQTKYNHKNHEAAMSMSIQEFKDWLLNFSNQDSTMEEFF